MNKSLLVAFAIGSATLFSCSSNPSDLRADKKVSVDQVPPGTRDTDIYNLNGGEDTGHQGGHGTSNEHGPTDGHGHDSPAQNNERTDVMPNHDEHNNDVGTEDVPAHEKTTDSKAVENHE